MVAEMTDPLDDVLGMPDRPGRGPTSSHSPNTLAEIPEWPWI